MDYMRNIDQIQSFSFDFEIKEILWGFWGSAFVAVEFVCE